MAITPPINFTAWIDEHRHLLKPPVGNAQVYEDTDFIIMVVGGPNARKDYHYNEGEEFFYQVEGDVVVKVIDEGSPRDITIKAGEIFLLPPRTPHSPRRPANTVGLVVERKRAPVELDAFMWFCEQCGDKLYEEFLPLTDIVAQLPPLFQRFWSDESKRTCRSCGAIIQPPTEVS